MAEHEAVRATHTNVELAGKELQAKRLRNPPTLEQLGPDPCLEHDGRRGVDGARDNELPLRPLPACATGSYREIVNR